MNNITVSLTPKQAILMLLLLEDLASAKAEASNTPMIEAQQEAEKIIQLFPTLFEITMGVKEEAKQSKSGDN